MENKKLLGILAKFPEPGKVKTRLANEIGSDKAAMMYKRIAERVIENTRSCEDYERVVFYSPYNMKSSFESWLSGEIFMPQKGKNIGERMNNALKDMFDMDASSAVVIGADIPYLNRDIIKQAFSELKNTDIVIGPAADGGYYLMGMNSPHPEIFHDIPWGTCEVFRKTVHAIEAIGLSYVVLGTLFDVDRPEDLKKIGGLSGILE